MQKHLNIFLILFTIGMIFTGGCTGLTAPPVQPSQVQTPLLTQTLLTSTTSQGDNPSNQVSTVIEANSAQLGFTTITGKIVNNNPYPVRVKGTCSLYDAGKIVVVNGVRTTEAPTKLFEVEFDKTVDANGSTMIKEVTDIEYNIKQTATITLDSVERK